MELTAENYYGMEANKAYMSVSQFKDFNGTYGKMACNGKVRGEVEAGAIDSVVGRKLCGLIHRGNTG